MHAALASDRHDPNFAPEPFTPFYQRGLYQSMRNQTADTFSLLRTYVRSHDEVLPELTDLVNREDEVLMRMRGIVGKVLRSPKQRTHGDLHLGQVLYTGGDFLITDFEGEPARPLTERKIKRTSIRDVAGMLRSFDYALHAALREERQAGIDDAAAVRLEAWGRYWQAWVSAAYLKAYLSQAKETGFLNSAAREEIELLLDVHMIEKAVYELAYELNNRPDWLAAPARGLVGLLESKSEARNEA
jgi:maltose alpha-D-glucosyltransferase/alpha-amylase